MTVDASDNGLAAVFDTPMNIRSDTIVDVVVQTEIYTAYMKCRVASVKQERTQDGRKWKYGFVIHEITDTNRRQYMQILYDRPHSLPKRFKENSSVFDDVNTNLLRRTRRKEFNVRKMPRLKVNLPFVTEEGVHGKLYDFNFEYARVDINRQLMPADTLTLKFGDVLDLVLMPNIVGDEEVTLYRIVNVDDILGRPDFAEVMKVWTDMETMPAAAKPVGRAYINTPSSTKGSRR